MKHVYNFLTLILVLIVTISAWAQHSPESHFSNLPMGGRRAVHGMVLFGRGPYFLEHIPMYMPPHDFQIITQVSLTSKAGTPINFDFSGQGFTLLPSKDFSLNDFIAGRIKSFSGAVYLGGFEQGGKVVPSLENVFVEVQTYKLIRQLPAASADRVYQLSDGKNNFESNIIRPDQGVQMIKNITKGKVLWCVKAPEFFDSCL